MSFAVHPEQHAPGEPAVAPGTSAPAAPPVSSAETVPAEHWWAPIERTLAGRLLASVADLPLSIVLPNGQEVGGSTRPPIARLRVADHATLLGLLGPDSELCFGDAYADGRLVVEGDLLELLVAAIRAPGDGWAARAGSWWRWIRRRGNSLTPCARQRTPPLRPRQRLLPSLARPRDGLHLCVLPDADARPSTTRRWPRWSTWRASCGCVPASTSWKPAAAGARWRSTWRGTTGSRSVRATSRRSRSPGLASAPVPRVSTTASSSSTTTIATWRAPAMPSSRSACWSTSDPSTTRTCAG